MLHQSPKLSGSAYFRDSNSKPLSLHHINPPPLAQVGNAQIFQPPDRPYI